MQRIKEAKKKVVERKPNRTKLGSTFCRGTFSPTNLNRPKKGS